MSDKPSKDFDAALWECIHEYAKCNWEADRNDAADAIDRLIERHVRKERREASEQAERLIAKRIREERIKAMEECLHEADLRPTFAYPNIMRLIAAERAKGEA